MPRFITVTKYLLVGQRVWHMAFTPDEKYLLTTNGVSNDVSVIDVAAQKVVKTIQVGELPWGVADVAAMTYGNPDWASHAVVAGCTAAFMIGTVLAYDPPHGFSRRPAGGQT